MTRTKAWLRVLGVGPSMQILEDEFQEVKGMIFHFHLFIQQKNNVSI